MYTEARGTLENLLDEKLLLNQTLQVHNDYSDELPEELRVALAQERLEGFLLGVYHFWCIAKEKDVEDEIAEEIALIVRRRQNDISAAFNVIKEHAES